MKNYNIVVDRDHNVDVILGNNVRNYDVILDMLTHINVNMNLQNIPIKLCAGGFNKFIAHSNAIVAYIKLLADDLSDVIILEQSTVDALIHIYIECDSALAVVSECNEMIKTYVSVDDSNLFIEASEILTALYSEVGKIISSISVSDTSVSTSIKTASSIDDSVVINANTLDTGIMLFANTANIIGLAAQFANVLNLFVSNISNGIGVTQGQVELAIVTYRYVFDMDNSILLDFDNLDMKSVDYKIIA